MSGNKICTRCGQTGLAWSSVGDKFFLSDANGTRHHCPPVTTASGVRSYNPPEPGNPEAAKQALMGVVAEVTQVFYRTLEGQAKEYHEDAKRIMETQIALAQEEFRRLMPQQHEIVIRSPQGTTAVEGRPHYALPRLVGWLNLREHVMTVGPAGSGKTTSAILAAQALDLPAYILPCGMATNDWSLLGFINPSGSYIPGHMRQPYEHGGVFVLDEIDNTNPSVLTTINGALSGSSFQFPDTTIPKHPDFVVVGCANTYGTGPDRLYVGRNQLDAATLDRFKKLSWGYDEDAEFDWAGRDQSEWVAYVQRVRHCALSLSMRVVISPRSSIGGARGLRNGMDWVDVSEDCLWNGMSEDDATRLKEVA